MLYDAATKPWMIVECKEMNVALDNECIKPGAPLQYYHASPLPRYYQRKLLHGF